MELTEFENLLNINFPMKRNAEPLTSDNIHFTSFCELDKVGLFRSSTIKSKKNEYLYACSFHGFYPYIIGFKMEDRFNREGITLFLQSYYGQTKTLETKAFMNSIFGRINHSSLTYNNFIELFTKEYVKLINILLDDIENNGDSILYFDVDSFVIRSQYEYLPMNYFTKLSDSAKHLIMTLKPIDKVCIAGKKRIIAIKDGMEVII